MRISRLLATLFVPSLAFAQSPPSFTLTTPNAKITEPFSRAMGLAELTDGRAIIPDFRESALYVVDFKTGTRSIIGRNGEGPNEYQAVAGVVRRLGDTLYVFDGRNRRYLRIDGTGKIAGTVSFPSRSREWSSPKGIDGKGHFYWTGAVVGQENGAYKRNQRAKIMKWDVVADSVIPVGDFADHAPELHDNKYFPYSQRDAYVVAADGRIGVLVARDYHLRWIKDGKVVSDAPPIPFTPLVVDARERNAFRDERAAQGPAGGITGSTGGSGAGNIEAARKTMLEYYPDEMFPKVMPPFVENGARLSPRGDIWVERSRAPNDRVPSFDVLGVDGKVRATVKLPAATQLVSLDRSGIYLVRVDDDGLQTLERHTWPTPLK
jgi:hypothetical protein